MAKFRSVIEKEQQDKFFSLCKSGIAQEVQYAIDGEADVNYTGTYDSTPLMLVARKNSPEAVKVLLDAGANTLLRDNDGKTALDYALENDKLKGTDIIGGLVRN